MYFNYFVFSFSDQTNRQFRKKRPMFYFILLLGTKTHTIKVIYFNYFVFLLQRSNKSPNQEKKDLCSILSYFKGRKHIQSKYRLKPMMTQR